MIAHDTHVPIDSLRGMVEQLADVVFAPLVDDVAQLDLQPGEPPLLWLDTDSPEIDLYWALADVLRLLVFGPEYAEDAEPLRARHLRAVS